MAHAGLLSHRTTRGTRANALPEPPDVQGKAWARENLSGGRTEMPPWRELVFPARLSSTLRLRPEGSSPKTHARHQPFCSRCRAR
jgi:hypothetical protein